MTVPFDAELKERLETLANLVWPDAAGCARAAPITRMIGPTTDIRLDRAGLGLSIKESGPILATVMHPYAALGLEAMLHALGTLMAAPDDEREVRAWIAGERARAYALVEHELRRTGRGDLAIWVREARGL